MAWGGPRTAQRGRFHGQCSESGYFVCRGRAEVPIIYALCSTKSHLGLLGPSWSVGCANEASPGSCCLLWGRMEVARGRCQAATICDNDNVPWCISWCIQDNSGCGDLGKGADSFKIGSSPIGWHLEAWPVISGRVLPYGKAMRLPVRAFAGRCRIGKMDDPDRAVWGWLPRKGL